MDVMRIGHINCHEGYFPYPFITIYYCSILLTSFIYNMTVIFVWNDLRSAEKRFFLILSHSKERDRSIQIKLAHSLSACGKRAESFAQL